MILCRFFTIFVGSVMKIVVAPDSFKECLPARRVAAVMAAAIAEKQPRARVQAIPLSDGGEGLLDVLAPALDARLHTATVKNPVGKPVRARFAVWGRTAIIEVAQACGLSLLTPEERRPLETDTRGVGELLLAARRLRCRHFLVGLGGSATCDGGMGMLSVPGIHQLKDSRFELLCDVDAPFIGPRGAARVFGPQKGASPSEVELLEDRMLRLAEKWRRENGMDVADIPGAGAAGGLGGAFLVHFGASRLSGIRKVLDLVHFREAAGEADLIITGEGRSDAQTLLGKVPFGVLQNAGKVPVALVSGRIDDREILERAGFGPIREVTPREIPLEEALLPETAETLLFRAVQSLL